MAYDADSHLLSKIVLKAIFFSSRVYFFFFKSVLSTGFGKHRNPQMGGFKWYFPTNFLENRFLTARMFLLS